MTKLEQLIQELCPNGVEYRKMGELGTFYGGITGKSKDDFKEGNAKFITYKNVYANPALQVDVPDRVRIGEKENQRTLEYGDIIFTGSSETPDECGISSVVTTKSDEKLYLNSFCFFFRLNDKNILLPDFSKHLFRSNGLRYQIGKTASGVTRFNVSKDRMKKVCIPIPPLEVQAEIVRILDKFTELTTELATELADRKKQFEYYRNHLLSVDQTHTVKLDDIATFTYGYTDTAKDNGNARFIRITDIDDNGYLKPNDAKYIDVNSMNEKYLVKPGDLLMARTGATYGKTLFVIDEEPAIYASFLIRINLDQGIILNRYYWHFSKSSYYWNQAEKLVTTGGQPQFNANALKQITVPIPPIEKQKEIIAILDRFDAISNDIHNGLPAEIEARQKQYEYYRDKLLTFKELKK